MRERDFLKGDVEGEGFHRGVLVGRGVSSRGMVRERGFIEGDWLGRGIFLDRRKVGEDNFQDRG